MSSIQVELPASKGQTVEEKDRLQRENVASRDEHQVEAPAPAAAPAPELELTHAPAAPAHDAPAHDAPAPNLVHIFRCPLPR